MASQELAEPSLLGPMGSEEVDAETLGLLFDGDDEVQDLGADLAVEAATRSALAEPQAGGQEAGAALDLSWMVQHLSGSSSAAVAAPTASAPPTAVKSQPTVNLASGLPPLPHHPILDAPRGPDGLVDVKALTAFQHTAKLESPASSSSTPPSPHRTDKDTKPQAVEDVQDVRKQKRLIRNRLSAQLHRERKKAYIDKLEAEVNERDQRISALASRVNELERDQHLLLSHLARHGLDPPKGLATSPGACTSAGSGEDTCATSREASEASDLSDGTLTPPPPSAHLHMPALEGSPNSRSADTDHGLPPPRKMPRRFYSGTMLAAVATLFLFHLPLPSLLSSTLPPPALYSSPAPPTPDFHSPLALVPGSSTGHPHGGGRVLTSVPTDEDDDAPSKDLPLVSSGSGGTAPGHSSKDPAARYTAQFPSHVGNSSYFVCPHILDLAGAPTAPHAFHFRDGSQAYPRPWREGAPGNHSAANHHHRRQLRGRRGGSQSSQRTPGQARPRVQKTPSLPAPPETDGRLSGLLPKDVEEEDLLRQALTSAPRDPAQVIPRFLLASPHHQHEQNETEPAGGGGAGANDPSSALVPAKYFKTSAAAAAGAPTSPGTPTSDAPYLMLLVPSSSIASSDMPPPPHGWRATGSSHWVEIGCQLFSARYVDDLHFSVPEPGAAAPTTDGNVDQRRGSQTAK